MIREKYFNVAVSGATDAVSDLFALHVVYPKQSLFVKPEFAEMDRALRNLFDASQSLLIGSYILV